MQHKKIFFGKSHLEYSVKGKGPVVVLLHGFGEDSTIWTNTTKYLHDDFKIIAPDLPGTGKSGLQEFTSIETLADAVHAVVAHEGVEKLVLIGHSMGGYVTMSFAKKYPEMLSGFGLFHSTAYPDSLEKMESRKKGIEFIQKNGAATFLETTTANLFSETTKQDKPELIATHIKALPDFADESLIAYYEAMMARVDTTEVLKATGLPVLFIIGKDDQAVPLKDVMEQTSLPATSFITILDASGHMGMLEEAEKSNEALKEFLAYSTEEK